jgi:hypothetical protein
MRLIAFLLLAFVWRSALAQSNVGELLDRGGVRLGKEALTHDLLASSWVLALKDGAVTWKADGTYTGYEKIYNGGRGIFGTWDVDAEGKLCFMFAATSPGWTPHPVCSFWYKIGDQYFASRPPFDRSAPIFPRFRKQP